MKIKFILKLLVVFTLFASNNLWSQNVIARPHPDRLVNNCSKQVPDFLSDSEEEILEEKLERFSRETSNQIVITIVDDLDGMDKSEYAIELGQKWGVGKADKDNGIVILLKPNGGPGQRQFFIAIGQGLEGRIPDGSTFEIQEKELIPYLKEGKNFEALDHTTTVLMALAKKEYSFEDYQKQQSSGNIIWTIVLVVFMIFIVVAAIKKGGNGGGPGSSFTYGAGGFIIGSGLGRSSGGGFGGGSSGGGFGGFGGGSFGGGGSGGSW